MAMTPGEIERTVRQLDHDVQADDELLAGISAQRSRHLNRLDALDAKLDGVEGRLAARLDGMGDQLTEILRRLPA